jgi:purine-binding chemotaxis protein CheW
MIMKSTAQKRSTAVTEETGTSCLIFSLLNKLYGVDANKVKEIVRLPEVAPLDGVPKHIVGVINLRGHVVPVLDINLRMGRTSKPYLLSDAVVVLEQGKALIGVIISEVREVKALQDHDFEESATFLDTESDKWCPLIMGVAKVEEKMVTLLDPACLLSAPDLFSPHHMVNLDLEESSSGDSSDDDGSDSLNEPSMFFPHATDNERTMLRERAKRLRQKPEDKDDGLIVSLAVVDLHGEFLGIDLGVVRGFAKSCKVTPIPCCPSHIVGNINLRGEILTILDIGRILEIPNNSDHQPNKVVVGEIDDIKVGILVNEVVDVIHLHESEIEQIPIATGFLKKEHLTGTTTYGDGMLSVLNLESTLTSKELVVDEKV